MVFTRTWRVTVPRGCRTHVRSEHVSTSIVDDLSVKPERVGVKVMNGFRRYACSIGFIGPGSSMMIEIVMDHNTMETRQGLSLAAVTIAKANALQIEPERE